MIDLTQLGVDVIALFAIIISIKVIPLIRKKCKEEDLRLAANWINFAVKAAEQMAESGEIEKDEKFQWVMEFIESKGFTLDWNEIKTLIEANVKDLPKLLTAEPCKICDPENKE